jgi:hypothetical protein
MRWSPTRVRGQEHGPWRPAPATNASRGTRRTSRVRAGQRRRRGGALPALRRRCPSGRAGLRDDASGQNRPRRRGKGADRTARPYRTDRPSRDASPSSSPRHDRGVRRSTLIGEIPAAAHLLGLRQRLRFLPQHRYEAGSGSATRLGMAPVSKAAAPSGTGFPQTAHAAEQPRRGERSSIRPEDS